jgi:putative DNA primase/helicase
MRDNDRSSGPIDFVGLAKALLDRARPLVEQWLPAGREFNGRWYVGDFDGSAGKSANVNLKTGTWIDNGHPGDKGGDLISLYGRIHGLSNLAAARELMRDLGWQTLPVQTPASSAPSRKKKPSIEWMPIHPVPADAPPYREQWAHYSRGVPHLHWEYRDQAGELLGLVARFDTSDGGKDVQPISFCQGSNGKREWHYKAFGSPRPLYGLWQLPDVPPAGDKRALAIVVEGEKKRDALFEALGRTTPVLAWPGGCKTPHMADWTPLRSYRVLCWPDADAQRDKKSLELFAAEKQPGLAAMRKVQQLLAELEVPVRIVDTGPPGSRPDGWDAADAIADGWTREQLLEFMRHLLPDGAGGEDGPAGTRPDAAVVGGGAAPPRAPAAPATEGDDDDPRWRDRYVFTKGAVRECVPNVMLVLHRHPEWRGVLGFDEFAQRVVKTRPAPYDEDTVTSTEWTDVDDTRTAAWIARQEGWVPGSHMVAEAATETAHTNRFHPVLQWLRPLQWDRTSRIDHWLSDFLHVPDTPYVRLVARFFLIGMCKRVLEPGVKFDYCLVLEGIQGRKKSSSLRALAGEWFSDTELDLANKDAMSNIRGKWLHEFSEMGSLARAESSRQKSFLSRQVDEFRPTYGRREIRCPRQLAFAGSTNEWQWNKDPTGGRRFWPVDVQDDINLEGLVGVREQLFAEAFALAQAGERYWPDAEEQRELFDPEQLARESPDAFVELIAGWLDSDLMIKSEFSMADVCLSGLKLDAKSMTKDVQTRVGIALRKLKCERVEYRTASIRFLYKRPARNAASSEPVRSSDPGDPEVPF